MKFTTLMENTACREDLCAAHGLSLYIETPNHKILFDMGPSAQFAENAAALGVDLAEVELAFLSHGHFDHSGGLEAFLEKNTTAPVYLHKTAFGPYFAGTGEERRYIGIDQALHRYDTRFVGTDGIFRMDDELTLFSGVPDEFGAMEASATLCFEKEPGVDVPDDFRHEQNLLITAEGKAVLVSGCAHRGIVNIIRKAETLLGRRLDAVISGFHLFQLKEGDEASDELIKRTAEALLPGDTVYYTGHCTGDYAFEALKAILGPRLYRLSGGARWEL